MWRIFWTMSKYPIKWCMSIMKRSRTFTGEGCRNWKINQLQKRMENMNLLVMKEHLGLLRRQRKMGLTIDFWLWWNKRVHNHITATHIMWQNTAIWFYYNCTICNMKSLYIKWNKRRNKNIMSSGIMALQILYDIIPFFGKENIFLSYDKARNVLLFCMK